MKELPVPYRGRTEIRQSSSHRHAGYGSKRRSKGVVARTIITWLLLMIVLGTIARLLLPGWVRDYVNRTLDRNALYSGKMGGVRIHLWRGFYSITEVQISKVSGDVPVPFFLARRIDIALERRALIHRRVVGRVATFYRNRPVTWNPGPPEIETLQ